jgi:hypothetical protein
MLDKELILIRKSYNLMVTLSPNTYSKVFGLLPNILI